MNLICINSGTYINLDALAFARPDRGIDGKIKLRLAFSSGMETQLSGESAEILMKYLENETKNATQVAERMQLPDVEHLP
jgi:hypothetical protein